MKSDYDAIDEIEEEPTNRLAIGCLVGIGLGILAFVYFVFL